MYGLIASLEKRNEEMRLHRTEVREYFRLVTLFQGDFDKMVRTSGAFGTESRLVDPDAFSAAQAAARRHLADIDRMKVAKFTPTLEKLAAAFETYAQSVQMFLAETQSLGLT